MGKNVLETIVPMAAIGLGAGAAGLGPLAGIMGGAGSVAPAAAPAFGAFGSADMIASGAAGGMPGGLLGAEAATEAALPSLLSAEAPIPYSPNMAEMADGSLGLKLEASGMTPNSYTGGYDALNGLERFGQRITGGLDQMKMNPLRMMNMGQPQQQQQQVSRPPAIQRPQQQPETQVSMPYGQGNMGRQDLTPEEMQQRLMLARMGRG